MSRWNTKQDSEEWRAIHAEPVHHAVVVALRLGSMTASPNTLPGLHDPARKQNMDPLSAARSQMELSLGFHIVFAASGIALPLLMLIAEGLWLRTGQRHYRDLARQWAKATGLLFAIGAVSGTALSFENEIQTAHDGLEAVEVAATFRPEVVLLDIGLPKLSGHDACRRIRQQSWGKNMVLVALTGWGQDEDRRQSKDAGFDHHMVKPVDFAALLSLLAELKVTPI
jgi:CheY-like chemotaxis protein